MESIDFDAASAAWRANKKYRGKGLFAYRCNYMHTDGKRCNDIVEAQKDLARYRTHPDWTGMMSSERKGKSSIEYCKRHRRLGGFGV